MSLNPLVSVIIPNFNHAPFLQQRIDSVLQQTFEDFEVIILDDKSTDNSKEIIESYRGHEKITHIVYNTTNSGSTFKQWEKGLKLAKGVWIWIAESDDVADLTFLRKLIENKSNESGIVYCRSKLINEKDELITLYNFNTMPDPDVYSRFSKDFAMSGKYFVRDHMLILNSIPNASAVVFKKELVKQSIFSEACKTKLLGDWLFWLSILKETNISFIHEALNSFRFHGRTVRNETHYTATRLMEYKALVCHLETNYTYKKEALDTLLYHYLKGEILWRNITLKEHISLNAFIFRRNPSLLFKSYLRKLTNKK